MLINLETHVLKNGRRPLLIKPRRIVTLGPGIPYVPGVPFAVIRNLMRSPEGKYWANVVMNEAKTSIVNRNIDLIADTLKLAAVTSTYTANADDQFIDTGGASDVVDARASGTTDQTLGGKTIGKDNTGDFAYFDANDVTFTAVPAGSAIVAFVLYKDTGTPTTSKIVAYFDTADITPNGGDITVQWAAPASGAVLKLA